MKFAMGSLSDEELLEMSALFRVFYDAAPRVYGALQDCCLDEHVRRQRARRAGVELADEPPVEVVLQVRGEYELKAATVALASHVIAAERCDELPRMAKFLREAFNDLLDMGEAQVEARHETIN